MEENSGHSKIMGNIPDRETEKLNIVCTDT
jgi:hypothetical protein